MLTNISTMKKTIWITVLASFFSFAQASAQQQIMPPHISVAGVGEVKVKPDEVMINFGVETRSKQLDDARKQVDSKAAAVINYLKKQGVEERHIKTSYMNVFPIYSNGEFGSPSPDMYMAQKTMTVVVRKLDKFDELLSGLYAVGVNRVDGISFRAADMEKHQAEARKRAIANAKAKATMLTGELGSKIARVYAIEEGMPGNNGPMVRYKSVMNQEAAMADDSGPSIAGGEVVVSSMVNVTFLID